VSTFDAIEKLKVSYPKIKVVIGGVHTSVMYKQILNKYNHIIAVIGEGEITFKELVNSIENGHSHENIAGIAYYKDGNVVVTKQRNLLEDLDILPFAKHEIFFDNEPNRTIGHIISSRGCPFNCSFCCLKVISNRVSRTRDMRKVVEEIKILKGKYPRLQHIQFHDDTLLLNNERVIEFCKLIISEKLGITFSCSARVKPISSEMFSWMARAGFTKIMFGLETGSSKLLESIHKKIKKEDVINLFNILKPFDFIVTTFLMCGFPGETEETIQETIALVKKTQKIHYNWIAGVGKLWVYPGSEVYQFMKDMGKISDDFWMENTPVPYFTAEHDLKTLVKFEEKMMNHLAISRILTFKGFMNHFLSMPITIISFLIKPKNRGALRSVIKTTIQIYSPRLYVLLYDLYKKSFKH